MICVVPRIAPRAKRRGCGRRPPARQLRHSLSQAYRCIHTRTYIYIYIYMYIHSRKFHEAGFCTFSAQFSRGFVSADLRNTCCFLCLFYMGNGSLRNSHQNVHNNCPDRCETPGSRTSLPGAGILVLRMFALETPGSRCRAATAQRRT